MHSKLSSARSAKNVSATSLRKISRYLQQRTKGFQISAEERNSDVYPVIAADRRDQSNVQLA